MGRGAGQHSPPGGLGGDNAVPNPSDTFSPHTEPGLGGDLGAEPPAPAAGAGSTVLFKPPWKLAEMAEAKLAEEFCSA